MRYAPVPPSLFIDRRRQFARQMLRDSVAIFYSNDLMPRTADQHYPFRQDSDLFALSGLDQPGTILVVFPSDKAYGAEAWAFILPNERRHVIWNGRRYTRPEAARLSGITTIFHTTQWDQRMAPVFRTITTVYVNTPLVQPADRVMHLNERMSVSLRATYPHLVFENAQAILRRMMMIKHPLEIDLMKKAIAVTGQVFDRVLDMIRPGLKEYEVEAAMTQVMVQQGCQHAFEPIVASGSSACVLHYTRNDGTLRAGQLVLLDFGAEYACMASDVSRTIPVSGRFTDRQRALYRAVHRILQGTTELMRPGISLAELNRETGKMVDDELVRLSLLTKHQLRRQDKAHPLRHKFFMHGVSHHLGYDVHDKYERDAPLRAGMILTCEPGLYIAAEKTGIRLENDIQITRGAPKNLTAHIPVDPEEIEGLMQPE